MSDTTKRTNLGEPLSLIRMGMLLTRMADALTFPQNRKMVWGRVFVGIFLASLSGYARGAGAECRDEELNVRTFFGKAFGTTAIHHGGKVSTILHARDLCLAQMTPMDKLSAKWAFRCGWGPPFDRALFLMIDDKCLLHVRRLSDDGTHFDVETVVPVTHPKCEELRRQITKDGLEAGAITVDINVQKANEHLAATGSYLPPRTAAELGPVLKPEKR